MSHDAQEINRMLIDRFEEVCQLLLPDGKKKGNHWVVSSINGGQGESLQITLTGSAAGRFIDFADKTVKGATPLWLWAKAKNVNFTEAIRQACEFLGIKDDDYGIKRHKQRMFAKPGKDSIRLAEPNTPVMDYLVIDRRIDPIVIAKAKVAETEDSTAIVFPFIENDKETGKEVCVHRKFLKLERTNGKKESWTTKGTKRCLYGKNIIDQNVSDLVICEGEIDCLSWNSWSIPAVSIPNGVSDFDWVDIDWEWLSRFEKIYISTDMDEPGRACSQEICKRLGLHRCFIVELPHKDANECLVSGCTKEDMTKCLASSKAIELEEIKRPDDFIDEVVDHYQNDPAMEGHDTPWYPALPWRVRRSEFTIFSGFSGSGKTIGLNQLIVHLVAKGLKVMDASLEIRPATTLYYMTRCAMAKKHATKQEAEACIQWLGENIFFLDCIGTVSADRIISAMEYARKRHGVDIFVIDSLFKCGLSAEDWNAQRQFADKLTAFCNSTGAHVILVAHSRKVQSGNEFSVPSKSDVAGSSDLTNAAFNVIVFWRNKLKKRKLDEARQATPPDIESINEWIDQPDGRILIDKQRFGDGQEGEVSVWYDNEACQFHTHKNMKMPYFQAKIE